MCGRCGSFESAWTEVSGQGAVASWIVNHHAFLSGFTSPYTVAMVRLDEQDDICIPGFWHGAGEPADGMAARVVFERHVDDEGEFTVVGWRPAHEV